MHTTLAFCVFWLIAFVTLCSALAVLNIFDSAIGNDLVLHGVGKEAVIAGVASLVEGACLWLIVTVVPAASRAVIVPAIIVALIYKISHFEDWSKGDVVMLLVFQLVIGIFGAFLVYGHFQAAVITLLAFVGILVVFAGFVKNL